MTQTTGDALIEPWRTSPATNNRRLVRLKRQRVARQRSFKPRLAAGGNVAVPVSTVIVLPNSGQASAGR